MSLRLIHARIHTQELTLAVLGGAAVSEVAPLDSKVAYGSESGSGSAALGGARLLKHSVGVLDRQPTKGSTRG
jgi:hypothetical protein